MTQTQAQIQAKAAPAASATPANPPLVVFVCANCARPGKSPNTAVRSRPCPPDFGWPIAVKTILIPCAGRLQPEHLLKAFEDGATAVAVVACKKDNCHSVEGSSRCLRRVDYVRGMLSEIGLGPERLMVFDLPGSARQDMAMGLGKPSTPAATPEELAKQIALIREQTLERLKTLTPNPMRRPEAPEVAGSVGNDLTEEEESDE